MSSPICGSITALDVEDSHARRISRPYQVAAFNTAHDSENKIHDDATAKKLRLWRRAGAGGRCLRLHDASAGSRAGAAPGSNAAPPSAASSSRSMTATARRSPPPRTPPASTIEVSKRAASPARPAAPICRPPVARPSLADFRKVAERAVAAAGRRDVAARSGIGSASSRCCARPNLPQTISATCARPPHLRRGRPGPSGRGAAHVQFRAQPQRCARARGSMSAAGPELRRRPNRRRARRAAPRSPAITSIRAVVVALLAAAVAFRVVGRAIFGGACNWCAWWSAPAGGVQPSVLCCRPSRSLN